MSQTPFYTSAYGIRHYWLQDGDSFRIASFQDTAPILEANKDRARHNDGYTKDREMRRVASIPFSVMLKWLNEEGWDANDPANTDKLAQKLNDPDWAHLRTAPGRIGVSNGVMR